MLVGIQQGRYATIDKFIQRYIDILKFSNIEYVLLDISSLNFWKELSKVNYFIFRYAHYDWDKQIAETILPIIENNYDIKCFPNNCTSWHFDDKIRQYYLMKANDFPMAESWIFYDEEKALNWTKTCNYPIVFKLKIGAGSSNVVLIKEIKQALSIVKSMFEKGVNPNKFRISGSTFLKDFKLKKFIRKTGKQIAQRFKGKPVDTFWRIEKNYALFQKYLPNNDFDTRVTIIGNRAFAFRRFNRDNDFRSSGSGKINYDMTEIDKRFIKLAFEISQKMKFQSMAYDFLYDENRNPSFCEISYTYQDLAVYNCPGFWDDKLVWHEGHIWPQYCQLVDLLDKPDLKQPILA